MKKMLLVLASLLMLGIAANGCAEANPHNAEWLDEKMAESLDSITRIDERGILYEMTYTADYYSDTVMELVEKASSQLSSGCSAFSAYNTEGEFILCRNYDYRHKDASGGYTGLHAVIRTAPEGKLKSIGVCDAYWLNPSAYYMGALDDGKTDTSYMVLAPYMCVDGMNEAGVTASLLVVDTKEGETLVNQNTGNPRALHSVLLRYIMDNAHTVEEAAEIAAGYDVYSTGVTDLHMYVSDKNGTSAVFEWRQYGDDSQQKLYVTYTNAITNFFVGFDDGENAMNKDGSLKELCAKITPTFNNYKYGYGHGYHRFSQIIMALERYISADANAHGIRNSVMTETQMLDVLRTAAQDPGTEKTSFTQFTALYHLDSLSVSFWLHRDYSTVYTVDW